MLIENNLLTFLVIISSGLFGFLLTFFVLKRLLTIEEKGVVAFSIFLTLLFTGGLLLLISSRTSVIIEVRQDSGSKFLHSYNRLIGNWIFNINDKTINTSKLSSYKTLIINYTKNELVIEPVLYSQSKDGYDINRAVITVPSENYMTFNDVIQYFFDNDMPPKSIKIKKYEHNAIRYWLHQIITN